MSLMPVASWILANASPNSRTFWWLTFCVCWRVGLVCQWQQHISESGDTCTAQDKQQQGERRFVRDGSFICLKSGCSQAVSHQPPISVQRCPHLHVLLHCRTDATISLPSPPFPSRARTHTCATALLSPIAHEVRMAFFLLAALACNKGTGSTSTHAANQPVTHPAVVAPCLTLSDVCSV